MVDRVKKKIEEMKKDVCFKCDNKVFVGGKRYPYVKIFKIDEFGNMFKHIFVTACNFHKPIGYLRLDKLSKVNKEFVNECLK